MALRIEDYALLGDTQSAALVGRDGSVDWLCLPRFDSDACFAALLGTPEHGRWLLAPAGVVREVRRAYREGTLVLDTEFRCEGGTLRVTDCMPPRGREPDLLRIAECVAGRVSVRNEVVPRFGYGRSRPWTRARPEGVEFISGPEALLLSNDAPVETRIDDEGSYSRFELAEGDRVAFTLVWYPSHEHPSSVRDPAQELAETEAYWRAWSGRAACEGQWRGAAQRSLITLKALTYAPTGGIVAAPTASLPECLGGARNWDYRFCWVRDATFTLYALIAAGYIEEARAWRDWLLRAAAGDPEELQILYGVAGERRLTELELEWLPGYEGSRPVRIGNAASTQLQLDIYGELMDTMHEARRAGLDPHGEAWTLQRRLLEKLEGTWDEPDEGIWEIRASPGHFTHSRVMAWVALDRAVRDATRFRLKGPIDRWKALRARIHAQVCQEGYDAERNSFVQEYGCRRLDASLLLIPLVGFLPPGDSRVRGTVDAIVRELLRDGLVQRYDSRDFSDGLPPGEGAFLPCSFWLVDCFTLLGRREEARALLERLLDLRNDVGLLSEEYDSRARRQVGNFPQAFTHVALVNAIRNFSGSGLLREGGAPDSGAVGSLERSRGGGSDDEL